MKVKDNDPDDIEMESDLIKEVLNELGVAKYDELAKNKKNIFDSTATESIMEKLRNGCEV